MKKLILAIFICLFSSASFAADTLEVFAFLVQFKQEQPDNSLTTGDGTFGSDVKNKDSYSLDPVKMRNSVSYWQKHFEFANAYYQAASGGKLAIKARIFPEASSGQSVYSLDKPIIDYNRTKKMKGEKTAEYDDARSRDYMSFVYDAVMKVHKSKNSPFSIPLSSNPNTKRAYMIIHAGASKLTDGGSMGSDNADTPGDFMDIYVSGDAWNYVSADSDFVAVKTVSSDVFDSKKKKKDTTVVTGLVLENAAMDTLKSMLVVSETASQDGLNWGINGILVNQIGRELGMPNTYDAYTGISRLGYYDLMDFAGYSAGNGFMPALPNAWNRMYMGWSNVKEVRPSAGKSVSVDIAAAGSGLGTEIVKVPLSASEYLLIENRQRSWDKNGKVTVFLSDVSANSATEETTVYVDSIGRVFEDSVCTKGKCKRNSKKAKGLILSLSSFDAGLPASGIAVWRVNEWYLREYLQYGVANYWGGDTLRDHQFGMALVEADGVLSIGKTFKNALGQDTYDYGSGTDLLPHKRFGSKSKESFDIVKDIKSTGYANTMTTQGGYTGISITVDVPENARKEKTSNVFMGDSVINYAAPVMRVTISIDNGDIPGNKFPREVGLNTAVRGAVFVDYPEEDNKGGEKAVVFAANDGTLQVLSALGDTILESDTSVAKSTLSLDDSVKNVPLYRVTDYAGVAKHGKFVGLAGSGSSVYSLYDGGYAQTKFESGMFPVQNFYEIKGKASVGPMVVREDVWFGGNDTLWLNTRSMSLGEGFNIQDIAFCGDPSKTVATKKSSEQTTDARSGNYVAVVGKGGRIALVEDNASSEKDNAFYASHNEMSFSYDDATFRVVCTDLDRDDVDEVVVLGSRGNVFAVKTTEVNSQSKDSKRTIWTHNYKRGNSGTSGLKDETSGIALGDINDDGYPEIVFLGDNLVYALDRFGVPLPNFPVKINRGTPVIGFFSDPLLVDVTGDKVPEILVPTSDGLVYAYTGKGKLVNGQFPIAAGSYGYDEVYEPMSIFVADAVPSTKSKGAEIYAFHRSNVSAFRLKNGSADAAENAAAWTLPAGGNERLGYFDASKLKEINAQKSKDEISEFFMFPNPVRGGVANARFEIGAEAKSATLELYDITGLCVYKKTLTDVLPGRNLAQNLDLSSMGSDVYTARLQVKFKSGKTKQKLFRVGVIH